MFPVKLKLLSFDIIILDSLSKTFCCFNKEPYETDMEIFYCSSSYQFGPLGSCLFFQSQNFQGTWRVDFCPNHTGIVGYCAKRNCFCYRELCNNYWQIKIFSELALRLLISEAEKIVARPLPIPALSILQRISIILHQRRKIWRRLVIT